MSRIRSLEVIAALTLLCGASVCAAGPAADAGFAGLPPVSDAQLARLRGGFSIDGGPGQIQLSLGIERLTAINGKLASVTRLGASAADGIRLIQNGAGNVFDASVLHTLLPGTLGTVIQNSLDGQTIRNLNVFNITVNSRQLAQSLAVQNSVTDALARAVR